MSGLTEAIERSLDARKALDEAVDHYAACLRLEGIERMAHRMTASLAPMPVAPDMTSNERT